MKTLNKIIEYLPYPRYSTPFFFFPATCSACLESFFQTTKLKKNNKFILREIYSETVRQQ